MTERERKRRALAKKRKRQRQIRQRLTIGIIIIAVFLIIVISVSARQRKKKEESIQPAAAAASSETPAALQPEAAALSTSAQAAEEQTTEAAAAQQQTAEQPAQQPAAETAQETGGLRAADYPVDRSTFAVQPGVPCGNNHMTEEKVVYLTLDDGPSYLTPAFLDVLDRYNVKCTFFVTAQDPEYFYLIKEAYDRGHTIGLHSYSHDYATIYTSPEAFFADLDAIGQVVAEQIGYVPAFIRFPGGSCNQVSRDYCEGIMTYLTSAVQERGYQYFDWNCSSGDGAVVDDVNALIAAATSVDYWENIVLLSHDCGGKETTLEALPSIIEYYLSNGYEFRPITRDAFTSHQEIFN